MFRSILDGIFSVWGVCPFEAVSAHLIKCRAESRLPSSPRSVIVVCFPYLLNEESYAGLNVSRYAAVPDYHGVAAALLEKAVGKLKNAYPENEFSAFADNSPIPEVEAACRAGIGVRGMNSLFISEKFGSFVFLGEIVTDLKIPCEDKGIQPCLKCGKCVSSCPNGAITPGGINRSLCLSDITQKKGELTEKETKLIADSGCLWGCDICQTVCPMNKNASATDIEDFITGAIARVDESTDIEGRAFAWRGKKTIDRNIGIFSSRKGE